jgi:hypothetical protein
MRTSLAVIVGAVACAACTPRDAEVRRRRLAVQERALVASLEDLQVRLLVDRAMVAQWKDLADRHQNISAVACTSQEAHATEMAERLLPAEIEDRAVRAGRLLREAGQARVSAFRTGRLDSVAAARVRAPR